MEPPPAAPGATRRTWTRAGRAEFVQAAVAYLEGSSAEAADARKAGGPTRAGSRDSTRATDEGPQELGIRLVATLVGKSPSAPLFHFPDRPSLLAAVAAEGFRRLAAHLVTVGASSRRRDDTALETMTATALSYVDWASDHAALFTVMYTPALASGVGAIQSGHDAFWRVDAGGKVANEAATAASHKRRMAFEELYEAKANSVAPFFACVEHAREAGVLTTSETLANITLAVVAMADGLAWQRITEQQLTPQLMQQHARRSLALLLKGVGAR